MSDWRWESGHPHCRWRSGFLADEFVADAEEDDTALAALAAIASDGEVFAEEAYADVVVEVETEEEILVEEIFGL